MKFVFGGGGTGGHVVPALALADELTARRHACSFIGNDGSVEARLCSANGYHLDIIKVQKLYRSLTRENLLFPYYLARSMFQSVQLLKQIRPEAVICTGGFVAGPVALAASMLKIPLFFHESNSYPGLVTRFMARKITRIYISFASTRNYLPKARLEHLGIPLKKKTPGEFELSRVGLNDSLPTILISGGSQGSVAINNVVDKALPEIIRQGYQLLWQSGATSYEQYATKHQNTPGVYIFAFSPDLPQMQNKAIFAITRAGAMTIAELEQNKVPAILIPLPTAAGNHQYFNAIEQQNKGIAILLPQNLLSPASLLEAIARMQTELSKYKDNLAKLPPNTASTRIVDSILDQLTPLSK